MIMKHFGLIGYPLTHSFSKKFFTEKFRTENIDACYTNFEIQDIAELTAIIKENRELSGLNVTIPYKQQVIPYLDTLEGSAKEIGAVNTIRIIRHNENITLQGYNTDTWGFENSIKPLLKPHHKNALILGTGGASKAVKYVLKHSGIQFVSASTSAAGKGDPAVIHYNTIDKKLMEKCLVIINATPLGTYPDVETYPPIPYEYITNRHLLYDLVYNPPITVFLEKGQAQGAIIKNGYDMLIGQALKSYDIWEH